MIVLMVGAACGAKSPGAKSPAELIAADPLVLLPPGVIGYARLDAQALFASALGDSLARELGEAIPSPASLSFVPRRDLHELRVGFYSITGVDFLAILSGRFTVVDASAPPRPGVTVIPYADQLIYLSETQASLVGDRLALVLLSPSHALFGTETAVRRALDRVADQRLTRTLSPWAVEVAETPGAAFAGTLDLSGVPPSAWGGSVPFLPGLERAAVLGGFKPPGLHLTGTFTYRDPASAAAARQALLQSAGWLRSVAPWAAMLGVNQPLHRLDTELQGVDLRVVAAIDPAGVEKLLRLAVGTLGLKALGLPGVR